jgi:hypothetical protein
MYSVARAPKLALVKTGPRARQSPKRYRHEVTARAALKLSLEVEPEEFSLLSLFTIPIPQS